MRIDEFAILMEMIQDGFFMATICSFFTILIVSFLSFAYHVGKTITAEDFRFYDEEVVAKQQCELQNKN